MIPRLLLFLGLALAPLFASPVRVTQPLVAEFTETRHTPLKKVPVVVTGTVRIDPARGLSLAYDSPRAPVVILDATGLLFRQPDGREKSAPPEAAEDLRLLHALFTFDLATLESSYSVAATETPDGAWSRTFTRLPSSTASYRELTLVGNTGHLTAIHLIKSPRLRTEITLSPPRFLPAFPPEELTRYFR